MSAPLAPPLPVTGRTPAPHPPRRRWWLSRTIAGWCCAAALLAAAAAIPVFVNQQSAVAEQGVHAAVARTTGSAAAALAPAWVSVVQVADAVARSEVRFLSTSDRIAGVVDGIALDGLLLGVRVMDLNGDIIAERPTGQFDFPATADLFADLGPRRQRVHPARPGAGGARIVPFSQLTTDQTGRPIAIIVYVDAAALADALNVIPTSRPAGVIDAVAEVVLIADDGSIVASPRAATPFNGGRLGYAPPAAALLDGETRAYVGRLRPDQPNQTIAYARVPNWPLLVVAASTDERTWLTGGRLIPSVVAIVGAVLAAVVLLAVLIGDRWQRHRMLLVQARTRAHHADRALASTSAAIVRWQPGVGGVYYAPSWKHMMAIADGEVGDQLEELLDRIHPSDKPAVLRNLSALATGQSLGCQIIYRVIAGDGQVKQILEGSAVERGAAGDTHSIVLTQIDLSRVSQGATDLPAGVSPVAHAAALSARADSSPKSSPKPRRRRTA